MKQSMQQLLAGTALVAPQEDLVKKLASGRQLKIKLGIDPTSPDLHLGHTVVLEKLRDFQEAGHEIILVIGDFTARIGDPTGRSKTRPPLTEEQIIHNFKTYLAQVGRVIDPTKLTIRYNREWLGALTSVEWLTLCAKVTLARLTEREDFAERIATHQPVGFHELVYPLLQGYDSIALQADVELGGTDQTFNLLMGRYLQEQYHQEPQVVMTLPLLPGLDGVAKMSKSLNNAIGLSDSAEEAYGKLMSISDSLMWTYATILLRWSAERVAQAQDEVAREVVHPMTLKKALAFTLVERFWGAQEAGQAQTAFEHLFQKKDFEYAHIIDRATELPEHQVGIVDLLKRIGATSSSSQARRLIEQGAVTVNGNKITDNTACIPLTEETHIKVGKHRFYKIV